MVEWLERSSAGMWVNFKNTRVNLCQTNWVLWKNHGCLIKEIFFSIIGLQNDDPFFLLCRCIATQGKFKTPTKDFDTCKAAVKDGFWEKNQLKHSLTFSSFTSIWEITLMVFFTESQNCWGPLYGILKPNSKHVSNLCRCITLRTTPCWSIVFAHAKINTIRNQFFNKFNILSNLRYI